MALLPRLRWRKPRSCEILQFSGTQVTALQLLQNEFSVRHMPLVTEEVNVIVLLHSLCRLKLSRWAYYKSFCALSRCKVVVVWHDTNIHAFALKRTLEIPVMCIQNGIRHDLGPASGKGFFSALKSLPPSINPSVDDYWVFSEASRQLLESVISANFHIHGSYRGNEFASRRSSLHHSEGKRKIGFIASFPNASEIPGGHILKNSQPFLRRESREISYEDWFRFDGMVCKAMARIAEELSLDCAIISKRPGKDTSEHRYFSQIIETASIPVIGHEKGDGYELANSFDFLVATDSTLGYEMLGLGSKVAFVSGRLNSLGVNSREMSFGWPLNIPDHGPFWISTTDEDEIVDFLRAFVAIPDSSWKSTTSEVIPRVMVVDPGNSALRKCIAEYVGRRA